ncbi:MAG TPA: anti-sigma factor [Nocardioidaceae bacterium]|jgi:anti-sigma-K factor RskA|nr:anti-sigma factor [Nocardioidaceae bacterium]
MSPDVHTLVGAYALDALDDREQADFEQHLHGCPTCSAELVELQATAARLGEAASMTPPAGLRESVLAAASRTPQQRPVVTVVPLSRWRRYGTTLVAAAAVVAAVSLGVLYVGEQNRNDELETQGPVSRVKNAPDVEVVASGPGKAPVRVYYSQSLDQAVVKVNDLPSIDKKHSYEMWAVDAEGPRSLGAMPEATESGTKLVSDLGDATQVAVTLEPAGGSPTGKPTGPAVEAVDLT